MWINRDIILTMQWENKSRCALLCDDTTQNKTQNIVFGSDKCVFKKHLNKSISSEISVCLQKDLGVVIQLSPRDQ